MQAESHGKANQRSHRASRNGGSHCDTDDLGLLVDLDVIRRNHRELLQSVGMLWVLDVLDQIENCSILKAKESSILKEEKQMERLVQFHIKQDERLREPRKSLLLSSSSTSSESSVSKILLFSSMLMTSLSSSQVLVEMIGFGLMSSIS